MATRLSALAQVVANARDGGPLAAALASPTLSRTSHGQLSGPYGLATSPCGRGRAVVRVGVDGGSPAAWPRRAVVIVGSTAAAWLQVRPAMVAAAAPTEPSGAANTTTAPATGSSSTGSTEPAKQLQQQQQQQQAEVTDGALPPPKKVFVAGATGQTGQRVVRSLLRRGIAVRAGVRSRSKGESTFSTADVNSGLLEFVEADVLSGVDTLASAIGPGVDAVIVATGYSGGGGGLPNPFLPWQVDNFGTVAVVDAAQRLRIGRLVLVSSLLVNGAAWGQVLNPAYIVLNLFGLVLIAKLQAENYIRRSGINFTIVRPGGLKSTPPSGNIVASAEDTLWEGSISRDSVAEVAVEALLWKEASYKVVEIVERTEAPRKDFQELFQEIP